MKLPYQQTDITASLLYLVTGKSDNNVKCQLPVYLRNELGWSRFPRLVRRNSTATSCRCDHLGSDTPIRLDQIPACTPGARTSGQAPDHSFSDSPTLSLPPMSFAGEIIIYLEV